MNHINREYKKATSMNDEADNFTDSDFKHSEYPLDEILEAEITNTSCIYFGESAWVTHKAHALGTVWYKCELGYEPASYDGVSVWVCEDELEFL